MSKSFNGETLVGKQFGLLTVLKFIPNDKNISYWLCECSCDQKKQKIIPKNNLTSGHTQSCGCLNSKNLKGQRFGKLTVIEMTTERTVNEGVIWKCQCSCDNKTIINVPSRSLITGDRQSCGCQRLEFLSNSYKNILGEKFGKLTVIEKTGKRDSSRSVIWLCQCDCGNKIPVEASQHSLTNNNIKSCGCIKSIGELNITNILNDNFISYQKNYTFDNLTSPKGFKLLFDFGIFNNSMLLHLIEFDGIQHQINTFNMSTEAFEYYQLCDALKNDYCKRNNIPLIRIPHHQRDNISLSMLQPDTSIYLIKS